MELQNSKKKRERIKSANTRKATTQLMGTHCSIYNIGSIEWRERSVESVQQWQRERHEIVFHFILMRKKSFFLANVLQCGKFENFVVAGNNWWKLLLPPHSKVNNLWVSYSILSLLWKFINRKMRLWRNYVSRHNFEEFFGCFDA